jgi:curli production assembly/transport component CsgF
MGCRETDVSAQGLCGKVQPLSGAALALAMLLGASPAMAGDLVYRPVNPAFGGSPLNKDFLMGTAESQNLPKRRDQKRQDAIANDPMIQFQTSLNQRLLSGLADKIVDSIYGQNAGNSGTFTVEGTTVSFVKLNGIVKLTVSDGIKSTVISLPGS